MRTDEGAVISRLSQDRAAIDLCNALDAQLRTEISNDIGVSLVLTAPIQQPNKLQMLLAGEIRKRIATGGVPVSIDLHLLENPVRLLIHESAGEEKKVVGLIANRNSSADIAANAAHILEDRIRVKAEKCRSLPPLNGIWLALLNDYDILADEDTYRRVLPQISAEHPFQRIVLVSTAGRVSTLYPD